MQIQPTRGAAQWSKDSVEHLRTVHFTLIAVCVALFLLSLAHTKTEAETAHKQIVQIAQFLHTFNRSWINDDIRMRFPPNQLSLLHGVNFLTTTSDTDIGTIEARLKLSENVILRVPDSFESWKPEVWRDNGIDAFVTEIEPGRPGSEKRTLKQFRTLWDMFNGAYVQVPATLSTNAYIGEDTGYLHKRKVPVRLEKQAPASEGSYAFHLYVFRPEVREFILQNQPVFDYKSYEIYYGGSVPVEKHFSGTPAVVREIADVWIPVKESVKREYDAQSVLILHANKQWDWKYGSFDASFRELNEVTKDYQDIDLNTIERIVRSDAQRTGESFEALGMKLSAEQSLQWGLPVILVTSLYFSPHPLELSPPQRGNRSGWDVAWMVLYSVCYASTLMFVTALLLHRLVVGMLWIRGF